MRCGGGHRSSLGRLYQLCKSISLYGVWGRLGNGTGNGTGNGLEKIVGRTTRRFWVNHIDLV